MCITSPRYAILVNGEVYGYFDGRRGLCQGEPISPILFTVVIELMSYMLSNGVSESKFQLYPRCKSLNLSHVYFEDINMIFNKGESDSLKGVFKILK